MTYRIKSKALRDLQLFLPTPSKLSLICLHPSPGSLLLCHTCLIPLLPTSFQPSVCFLFILFGIFHFSISQAPQVGCLHLLILVPTYIFMIPSLTTSATAPHLVMIYHITPSCPVVFFIRLSWHYHINFIFPKEGWSFKVRSLVYYSIPNTSLYKRPYKHVLVTSLHLIFNPLKCRHQYSHYTVSKLLFQG